MPKFILNSLVEVSLSHPPNGFLRDLSERRGEDTFHLEFPIDPIPGYLVLEGCMDPAALSEKILQAYPTEKFWRMYEFVHFLGLDAEEILARKVAKRLGSDIHTTIATLDLDPGKILDPYVGVEELAFDQAVVEMLSGGTSPDILSYCTTATTPTTNSNSTSLLAHAPLELQHSMDI